MDQDVIVVLSCTRRKGHEAAPAEELYTSEWFRKARAYAEATGGRWFILSAKHGLVEPRQVLAPYEHSLREMPAWRRRCWGRNAAIEIGRRITRPTRVVFLCGSPYREPVLEFLRYCTGHPVEAVAPIEGLGIGQQLAWLTAQIAGGNRHPRAEEA